jgi:mono/diheme cytochrome c family protein
MKKLTTTLLLSSLLLGGSLYANKCVCFELKGEFGDEIMEIMKKYSKNLGEDEIEVVSEEKVGTVDSQSFVDSLLGSTTAVAATSGSGYDRNAAAELYKKQCAACHGDNGLDDDYGPGDAIAGMPEDRVLSDMLSYKNGNYEGSARFVKRTITQAMTKSQMRSIAKYISELKNNQSQQK